jgi:hypothetical protein
VSRCEHCPVEAGKTCLGDAHPEAFPHFCRWATSPEPREREMVVLRSELGYEAPAPRVEGDLANRPASTASALAQLPLAGNLVAALTKRMGIDWVVKTVADELGVDCHCVERQQKLNALDAKLRRFLGW